ncbi:MAG: bifunctional DNA primase/polymerase [Microthrixaceae bacterium]|nr:bifunctional DNA primase/polymerase [Microthrixaceae bacterium]
MTATIAQNQTLTTALGFAGMGIPVLPLTPGDKAPYEKLAPHGFNDATTDPDTIESWFTNNPEAGLGAKSVVLTDGRQFVVLDADDESAAAALSAVLGEPSVLPAGHRVGKHPGGTHYYVLLSKPIDGLDKNTLRRATGVNIDVIVGGYIVAPPTTVAVSPDPYRWCHREPDAFIELDASHPLYQQMVQSVADEAEERRAEEQERAARATARADADITTDALDEWMRDTPWAQLLTDDGWTEGRTASCGCTEWMHPWGASVARSAIAHEEGCAESRSGFVGGALHVFSSTAELSCGGASVSKFMYVANVRHGSDYAAARTAEGIEDEENWNLGGCSFEPPVIDLDADPRQREETKSDPREPELTPRDPSSKVTGRVLADGKWIYDATTAARCGWGTPVALKENGDDDDAFSPWDRDMFPKGHPSAPDLMHKVFDFNDFTRQVFKNARAANPHPTGPFALLGVELVRGIMRIDPGFMPMRGTPSSLAFLRAGDSGKGKSLAMKAGKWTNLNATPYGGVRDEEDTTFRLGSGQALVNLLSEEHTAPDPNDPKKTVKVRTQKSPCRVWLEDPEYRSMLKRAKGDASVIFDSLNEAWAGEHPGTATISNGWVELNAPFTVCSTGGMQSMVWRQLLEQTTGWLQRLLLTSVSDPWRTLPDNVIVNDPAPPPTNSIGFAPVYSVPAIPAEATKPGFFKLPTEVYDALKLAAHNAAFEHTSTDDEWESHLLQVRIRVACAMAIRCGTVTVSSEIWQWSAYLIEHHRRVIAWIKCASERHMTGDLTQKGSDIANVQAAQRDSARMITQTVAEKILDAFKKGHTDTLTMRDARRAARPHEHATSDAIDLLVKQKVITIHPSARRDSQTLRLVTTPKNAA